jgi:hypothetical protein
MPDHPAVKAKVKHKKREVIVEPFIKNHKIVEDLKSAYYDIEEVSDESEESGYTKNNKNSTDNAEAKKELTSKDQNNQTII